MQALTAGPPVDPRTVPEPWHYADTGTWVAKPSLDMIVVSPHGMTLPGGFGPGPIQNPFWFDWNPRYAAGGDSQRYDTPPPRFETFLVDELVPFVDASFPTGGTRAQRAIVGTSMGGVGALANGFRHPDVWSSVGARSGGGAPFGVLDDLAGPIPLDLAPPLALPPVPVPGVVPTIAPAEVWDVLYGSVATVGFGDLVADSEWWRSSQPHEHTGNLRAWAADGTQSTHVKFFSNDMIPRRGRGLRGRPRGRRAADRLRGGAAPHELGPRRAAHPPRRGAHATTSAPARTRARTRGRTTASSSSSSTPTSAMPTAAARPGPTRWCSTTAACGRTSASGAGT